MKQFDILLKEPEISSDKIEAHQDFAGLMARYQQHHVTRKARYYKTILGLLALLLAGSGIWFITDYPHGKVDVAAKELSQPVEIGGPKATEQNTGEAGLGGTKQELNQELEAGEKEVKPMEEHDAAAGGKEELSAGNADSHKVQEQSKPVAKTVEKPKPVVDEEPIDEESLIYTGASPKEGFENLHAYFNEYLVYPEEELLANKEGTVLVSFLINEAGNAEKIEITRSVSPAIDQEAIRLIREMPAWNPADVNGKPVISRLNLPVIFKITDYEKY